MLCNEFERVGVWTFGYPTSISKIAEWFRGPTKDLKMQGTELLNELLSRPHLQDKAIAFVCHSMGGLVLKECLSQALDSDNPQKKKFFENVIAAVFLATPHGGALHANRLKWLDWLSIVGFTTIAIKDLSLHNPRLGQLRAAFALYASNSGIKVLAIREVKPYRPMRIFPLGIIVNEDSADPHVDGVSPIPVQETHCSMTTPAERSEVIERVRKFFGELCSPRGVLDQHPTTLQHRWDVFQTEAKDLAKNENWGKLLSELAPFLLDSNFNRFVALDQIKILDHRATATCQLEQFTETLEAFLAAERIFGGLIEQYREQEFPEPPSSEWIEARCSLLVAGATANMAVGDGEQCNTCMMCLDQICNALKADPRNSNFRAHALSRRGCLELQAGSIDKAIAFLEEARSIIKKSSNFVLRGICCGNIGYALAEQRNFEPAISYLLAALDDFEHAEGVPIPKAHARQSLAELRICANQKDRMEEIMSLLDSAERLATSVGALSPMAVINATQSLAHILGDNLSAAVAVAKKGIDQLSAEAPRAYLPTARAYLQTVYAVLLHAMKTKDAIRAMELALSHIGECARNNPRDYRVVAYKATILEALSCHAESTDRRLAYEEAESAYRAGIAHRPIDWLRGRLISY
ncbi:MAG: hypothetical protein ACRER2_08690 [Methylococcales bacterium]